MLRKVNLAVLLMQAFLCVVSAAMLFASYPYPGQHYLAWFAFVPWITAVQNVSRRRALALSFLTGLLFWGATVYWLIHVTLLGMVCVVLYLSLYFAAFGLIVSVTRNPAAFSRVLFIPSVWVLLEFLRSHALTGFPWALAAYTQSPQLTVIQAADITGPWGISFLVLAVNTAIQGFITSLASGRSPRLAQPVFVLILLAACVGYGSYRLAQPQHGPRVRAALVQGNVPHEEKWREGTQDAIMQTHLALTDQAASSRPDLIVWSEAALPVILQKEPEYFEEARREAASRGIPLLLGAITVRDGGFYNSALLIRGDGDVDGSYDKMHLVPFGEYIPLRNVFPFLETLAPIGQLTPGDTYSVFTLPLKGAESAKFSVLICFEDLFPEMARGFVKNGASFLVNITNDAWYRYSAATYQHRQAAVFRAVENRVPVIRCANTGVSSFIDSNGRVTGTLSGPEGRELFFEGTMESSIVTGPAYRTFYGRYGDHFIWVCWFFVLVGAVLYFMDRL